MTVTILRKVREAVRVAHPSPPRAVGKPPLGQGSDHDASAEIIIAERVARAIASIEAAGLQIRPGMREGIEQFEQHRYLQDLGRARKGDWIITADGKRFWPLDANPPDVSVGAIAHSLSHLCRYAGHPSRFYSVAEHATLASYEVERLARERDIEEGEVNLLAFAALHHDDTESYMNDVVRPLKVELSEYNGIEAQLASVIEQALDLPEGIFEHPLIKEVDRRMYADEVYLLFPFMIHEVLARGLKPLGAPIPSEKPDEQSVRQAFLRRHEQLLERLQPVFEMPPR